MPEAQTGPEYIEQIEALRGRSRTGLVTLLFTDVVGSTQLKQVLGDQEGVALLQQHHAAVRELLRQFPDSAEISTAGDSFFVVCVKPSDAVRFALLLHARNRARTEAGRRPMQDRIGIHLGEVVVEEEDGRHRDLHGLHVDLAARVMSLAEGGQTLLSRSAFDNARQAMRGEELTGLAALTWLNHGPYLLKGIEEAVEICEVGEAPWVTAKPPGKGEKAQRKVSADEEPVLGWRPALGQLVPNTRWLLERKLGEGGFGEVWLGRHQTMKERRVFKFCFQADRIRSLKREMTLFRLIKDRIGDHPNIVSLREVCFDQPPFYVEMDYAEGADLKTWSQERGGPAAVPMELKLEIVAQMADALQAAHDAGVIHRDVKPGNILVGGDFSAGSGEWPETGRSDSGSESPGKPPAARPLPVRARLTDFGIGQVVSQEHLAGVTRAGFTMTLLGSESSSQSGTHLYMAPELLAGKPATTRSDLYSLGVVLYQFLLGDFSSPLTVDWARRVEDPLLREDLSRCFTGEIGERFGSAAEFALSLRRLKERHAERERLEAEQKALERAAYRRGMMRMAAVGTVIVVLIAGLALWALSQSRSASRSAQSLQRYLYGSEMALAWEALEEGNVQRTRELLTNRLEALKGRENLRGFEWRYLWERSRSNELFVIPQGGVSVSFSPNGRLVAGFEGGSVKFWDVHSRQVIRSIPAHESTGCSLDFSPDGTRLATASRWAPDFKVWEVATGRLLAALTGTNRENLCVRFSRDGTKLATVAGSPYQPVPAEIKVWDLATQKVLRTLEGNRSWSWRVDFSADDGTLAIPDGEGPVRLWDLRTGAVRVLAGHTGFVPAVRFSPDDRILATGDQNGIILLWDWRAGTVLRVLTGHRGPPYQLAISPDGRWLASCGLDHTARLWDLRTGDESARFLGHDSRVWACDLAPDGQTLATAGGDGIRFWRVAPSGAGEILTRAQSEYCRVGYSPDGRFLFLDEEGGRHLVTLWDSASMRIAHTLPGRYVAFAPAGGILTLLQNETNVVLYDAVTLQVKGTIPSPAPLGGAAARSPDGRLLALRREGRPVIFDLVSQRESRTLEGTGNDLAFSADSRMLIVEERQGIRLWDSDSGKSMGWLCPPTNGVERLAIPASGNLLASSHGPIVRLWNLENQTPADGGVLGQTGSSVNSLAFSADGRNVAAGTYDGVIQIWNVPSRREVGSFRLHRSIVRSLAFSPDGTALISQSYDSTVRLWRATSTPPGQSSQ